ncbi:unnamed protein product [Acanthoscelides obtectus]|nr:unnamed protein product [Acanthoscelides obtectus]CAK1633774.1 Protein spaetzle 5 [Acanthoscelides obtectus]
MGSLWIFFIAWASTNAVVISHTICTPVYGSPHDSCSFLPAPPGKTPPCARPGLTYCEHPDRYPSELIHYLLEKWRYDHHTILMDESREDFASYITPSPPPVYGPPNYHHHQPFGPSNFLPQDNYYPEPIYIPKPQYPFHDHPGGYIPPKGHYNYTASQDQGGHPSNFKYNNFPSQNNRHYNPPYSTQGPSYFGNIGQTQYPNDIWERKVESLVRLRRSLRRMQSHLSRQRRDALGNGTTTTEFHSRVKRQSKVNGEQLCAATSNYIVPKAALNNKGNWMYVVNMPEVDSRASQLVKTETCA